MWLQIYEYGIRKKIKPCDSLMGECERRLSAVGGSTNLEREDIYADF